MEYLLARTTHVTNFYIQLTNKKPTRCHLLPLFCLLEPQHVSGINMSIFKSLRLCCWTTTLAVSFCKDGGVSVRVDLWCLVVCDWCGVFCRTPNQSHTTKLHKSKLTLTPPPLQNETAIVVVQQNSGKLLKMDTLMPETCCVSKK